MASSLALKRLVSSSVLPRSLCSLIRPTAVDPASLFSNTNAVRHYNDDGYKRDLDVDSRFAPSRRDDYFTEAFSPSASLTSLSQVLNSMNQMVANPFFNATRRGWDVRETDLVDHLALNSSYSATRHGWDVKGMDEAQNLRMQLGLNPIMKFEQTQARCSERAQGGQEIPLRTQGDGIERPKRRQENPLLRRLFSIKRDEVEEVLADYVHQEMTRNLIVVYWTLFRIILIKDVILSLFF